MGRPFSAEDSKTITVPCCWADTVKSTCFEKSPRQPVPHVAVVKVSAIFFRLASRIRMLTVASKTSAVPATVTGLDTVSPGDGFVTTMAGNSSTEGDSSGETDGDAERDTGGAGDVDGAAEVLPFAHAVATSAPATRGTTHRFTASWTRFTIQA